MECWAALSFCKRDVNRGPINPRQPKDFENFRILEYRQELRVCSLDEFHKYKCVEKDSELCFEVLRNFQDPLPVSPGHSIPEGSFPHEIGAQFPSREELTEQPLAPLRTTARTPLRTTLRTTLRAATETDKENDSNKEDKITVADHGSLYEHFEKYGPGPRDLQEIRLNSMKDDHDDDEHELYCELCFREGKPIKIVTSHGDRCPTCPSLTPTQKERILGPYWKQQAEMIFKMRYNKEKGRE